MPVPKPKFLKAKQASSSHLHELGRDITNLEKEFADLNGDVSMAVDKENLIFKRLQVQKTHLYQIELVEVEEKKSI